MSNFFEGRSLCSDYKNRIFIQKETSENENKVMRSEFDRWEWDAESRQPSRSYAGVCGEGKHYLHNNTIYALELQKSTHL